MMNKTLWVSIILLVMGTVVFLYFKSKYIKPVPEKYKQYKTLAQVPIEVGQHELVKIARHWQGPRRIDGINYFNKAHYDTYTKKTIVMTSLTEYEQEDDRYSEKGPCYLFYAISKQGHVIDTLRAANNIYDNNGVFFYRDYYLNWMNDGDKTRHEYLEQKNIDHLSVSELKTLLDAALQVGIDTDVRGEKVFFYLKENDGWRALVRTHLYDGFHAVLYTDMGEYSPDFKSYFEPNKDRYTEMEYYSTRGDKEGKYLDFIEHEYFQKLKKHKSSLGDFNNNRRVGWSGVGYFKLNYMDDSLCFKATSFGGGLDRETTFFPISEHQQFVIISLGKSDYDEREYNESGIFLLRKRLMPK